MVGFRGGDGALAPKLEELTVNGQILTDVMFREESRPRHPFTPWGITTKFYVKFTVYPYRKYVIRSQRCYEISEQPTFQTGVVLARAYEGRDNLCIWSGQIFDALLNVGGINAEIAKAVATHVHDRIHTVDRHEDLVMVDVEMIVVSPVVVNP